MWAGSHHLDVTNNSYFADPWLFNCRNDPGQRAIWKAEQRAIRYAMQQGVIPLRDWSCRRWRLRGAVCPMCVLKTGEMRRGTHLKAVMSPITHVDCG
jgi:hypothetical protein